MYTYTADPSLMRLDAGRWVQKPAFDLKPVRVGYVVSKVALGQDSFQALHSSATGAIHFKVTTLFKTLCYSSKKLFHIVDLRVMILFNLGGIR